MKLNSDYINTSDGVRIHYSCNHDFDPSKRSIFFNNGLVCSNQHFLELAHSLYYNNFNVILHDYRAHYLSEGKNKINELSFKLIARDISELLAHLNITQCSAIGHSMGVNITLECMSTYPDLFSNAVFISGTVLPVRNIMFDSYLMEILFPYLKMALEAYPDVFSLFWSSSNYAWPVKKIIQMSGFNSKHVDMKYVDTYVKKLTELGPELFFKLFHELSNHDILTRLHTINRPCLIMGGDSDRVIPWHIQNVLHTQLENSKVYLYKDGSHVPQVDFPEITINRVLHFLNA